MVEDALIRLAAASLDAPSASRTEEIERTLISALAGHLRADDGFGRFDLFAASPSAAIARQLWRGLIDAWRVASSPSDGDDVVAMLFAIPVVIVSGAPSEVAASSLTGVIGEVDRLSALLRTHRALGGNLSFALAAQLVAADALDIPRLPMLLGWQRLSPGGGEAARALHPTPMAVHPGQEGVHLRFLIGTAVGSSAVDPFAEDGAGEWALPLARELSRQLAAPGVSVLCLPRPPRPPLLALQHGRTAQREVGAQLFASNAIRRFRASVGEPSAVISAHRCAAASGGGELRLSLSSPFDARDAEGFRCPLFPSDRVDDVATMLVDLMRDCRVTDIRVVAGVHPDRDPGTGMTLLFRADAIPEGKTVALH